MLLKVNKYLVENYDVDLREMIDLNLSEIGIGQFRIFKEREIDVCCGESCDIFVNCNPKGSVYETSDEKLDMFRCPQKIAPFDPIRIFIFNDISNIKCCSKYVPLSISKQHNYFIVLFVHNQMNCDFKTGHGLIKKFTEPSLCKIRDVIKHDPNLCFEVSRLFSSYRGNIFSFNSNMSSLYLVLREIYCTYFSWAIPSKNILDKLSMFLKSKKTLEICAGNGFWSFLLQSHDINIIPTSTKCEMYKETWCDVHDFDLKDAIKTFNDCDCLFLCWGYNDITDSMIEMFLGRYVIIIGERCDGCTFNIDENNKFLLLEKYKIPQWSGIHDSLFFYERKNV